MRLQYQIEATGIGQLKRVFRSVEQEQQASATRSANRYTRTWARTLAQVKREAMAAERSGRAPGAPMAGRLPGQARGVAGSAAERAGHQRRLRDIDAEGRRRIQTIKDAASVQRAHDATAHRAKLRNIEAEKHREVSVLTRRRIGREPGAERTAGRVTGFLGRSVSGAVGDVARVGGGILALGGGFAGVNAVQSQLQLGAQASSLANQAGMPKRKGEILATAQGVKGVTAPDALAALEQWQGLTGDLAGGMKMLPQLAKVSIATGTDLADMTAAAGNALNTLALDIKDPTARMKALDSVMRTISAQGAVGAVEVKMLATEMAGLAASSQQFSGGAERSLKVMGAMAQTTRAIGGASSAAEAITSLERFASELSEKSVQFKALGVDVWTKGPGPKKLRPQEEIVVEFLKKTKGDPEKLGKMFNERSIRAVRGYQQIYADAETKKKGGGEAAVRAEFSKYLNVQTGTQVIQERYQSRLEDPDIKLMEVTKSFNREVGTRLIPVLEEITPKLKDLIPAAADATQKIAEIGSWAVENPFHGVAAIIATKVGADLATAGIGAAVKKSIEGLITGQMSMMGKLGAITVAGATFYFAGRSLIDFIFDAKDRGTSGAAVEGAQRGADIANAQVDIQRRRREWRSGIESGAISAGTPEPTAVSPVAAKSLLEGATGTVEGLKSTNAAATQGLWETLKNSILGTGPGFLDVREAQAKQGGNQQALADLAKMQELLRPVIEAQLRAAQEAQAAAQAQRAAVAGGGGTPGADSPKRNSPIVNRGG